MQETTDSPDDQFVTVAEHLMSFNNFARNFPINRIYNMDKVPNWTDGIRNYTMMSKVKKRYTLKQPAQISYVLPRLNAYELMERSCPQ